MSDSSLSDGIPADSVIEETLRTAVLRVYKVGNLEDLTIKRIRKSVESNLGLDDEFFKNDPDWKDKSKSIIQAEVDARTEAKSPNRTAPLSPPAQKKSGPAPKESVERHGKIQGTKRAPSLKSGPKKRRKKEYSEDEPGRDEDSSRTQKLAPRIRKQEPSSSISPAPDADGDDVGEEGHGLNGKFEARKLKTEPSESEMSDVLDEAPNPKKRARKSGSPKPKAKKAGAFKIKKASEEPADPDIEEIKRLQGWLVKCGIRKMWFKELAPYNTAKTKIRHLKDMLAEAGMTGRYSAEKANKIREERELKADLEAVQQGNKHWGTKGSDEEDASAGKPRRRLARGLEGLDFLNDDDGEETD